MTRWLWPLLVTHSQKFKVIQVALSDFTTALWNAMFAMTVIAIIIPVLILLSLQRYFVQGVANTGIKE
ncbi:hypothetical protein [Paenibacillus tyrfis]|uniref:hypothetical protein n=1 Tax=Paenibacillus tyrfis TaxID=1501230 RepID=UPI000B597CEE|nr:hypothetical protein [Paenibacillus tyrfis]